MGYLLHILLAIGAEATAEAGFGWGDVSPLWGLVLLPLPQLLAWLARYSGERGRFRAARLSSRLLSLSAPLGFACLALGTAWLPAVREWSGARLTATTWPEWALFVVFAPYLVLQVLAIRAEVGVHAPRGPLRRRLLAFQLRMFGSALVPLGIYVGVSAALGLVPGWTEKIQHIGLLHASFVTGVLGLLALALPVLLTNTWDTIPLPSGPQRSLLEAVARRADFHPRELRVWRTGHLLANAAIVGVGGRRRVVLFSDSLLAALSPRELAAVYAHEIGHAKLRHVTVFLAWALGAFFAADLATGWLAPESEWLAALILVATLGLWALGFGWLSRRCELEADLFSLQLLGDPSAMVRALERVGGRLRDVAGWRHFSTGARVAFLERAWIDPAFARRFRRRLRLAAAAGALFFLLTAGGEVWTLVQAYPLDRVRAELALGRWDRALECARDVEGIDPDLLAALHAGAARQGDRESLGAEELAGGLEACLTLDASWVQRGEYATLLGVLGRPGLDVVALFCERMGEGDREAAAALLGGCPERWRGLLESASDASKK